MPKFKMGDRVKLVSHSLDSSINLDIGYTGTVLHTIVSEDPHLHDLEVEWDKVLDIDENGTVWWVSGMSVRHVNLVLENK